MGEVDGEVGGAGGDAQDEAGLGIRAVGGHRDVEGAIGTELEIDREFETVGDDVVTVGTGLFHEAAGAGAHAIWTQIAGGHFQGVELVVRIDGQTGDDGEIGPDGLGVAVAVDVLDPGGAVGMGGGGEIADIDAALVVEGDGGEDGMPLGEIGDAADLFVHVDEEDEPAVGIDDPETVAVVEHAVGLAQGVVIAGHVDGRVGIDIGGQIEPEGDRAIRAGGVDAVRQGRGGTALAIGAGGGLQDIELRADELDVHGTEHIAERIGGGGETAGDRDGAAIDDFDDGGAAAGGGCGGARSGLGDVEGAFGSPGETAGSGESAGDGGDSFVRIRGGVLGNRRSRGNNGKHEHDSQHGKHPRNGTIRHGGSSSGSTLSGRSYRRSAGWAPAGSPSEAEATIDWTALYQKLAFFPGDDIQIVCNKSLLVHREGSHCPSGMLSEPTVIGEYC